MDVIVFKPKAFAALYFSLLKYLKMTTYALYLNVANSIFLNAVLHANETWKAIYEYSTYKMLRILVSLQF